MNNLTIDKTAEYRGLISIYSLAEVETWPKPMVGTIRNKIWKLGKDLNLSDLTISDDILKSYRQMSDTISPKLTSLVAGLK